MTENDRRLRPPPAKRVKLSLSKVQTRSGWRWQVRHLDPDSLAVRRRAFVLKSKAEEFAEALRARNTSAVAQFALLRPEDQSHLMLVWREARTREVDLLAAVVGANGVGQAGPVVRLGKCVAELVVALRSAGRDKRYLAQLEALLNRFAQGREGVPMAKVGLPLVRAFLDGFKIESRSTIRARLSGLFSFAVRQGYRMDNPCARLERVALPDKPKRILSPAELLRLLKWLPRECPRLLPWFVLSTFCGLRPEEAEKTTPKEIHFREGWIKVEAQTTKVRMRRVVYPKREAMRLLKAAVDYHPPVALSVQSRRAALNRATEHLHWPEWYQDVTRHSAASYWLAIEPDVAKVAAMLGNSPAVLLKHYKALVTRKEAARFWRLTF